MLLLSIAASQNRRPVVTGGTLTNDGTYYYRTFNVGTSSLVISQAPLTCDIVVQAGGGRGDGGSSSYGFGGGGGGTVWIGNKVLSTSSYSVVVGAGSTTNGVNGGDSTFGSGFTVAKGGGSTANGAGGSGSGYITGAASTQSAGSTALGIGYGSAGGSQTGNAKGNAQSGGGGSGGGGGNSYADLGGASATTVNFHISGVEIA